MADNSTPRVVVVDESPSQIALYERSVSSLEADLASFCAPEEALEYLRAHGAELVLLDLAMSGRDGLSWLQEMRKMERHTDTTVVVVTSKDYAQDRSLARELGAVDYRVKPLRSQEIRDLIAQHSTIRPLDDAPSQ